MDMRVYNGCLSDDLRDYIERLQAVRKRLEAKLPGAHATYFPMEQKWAIYQDLVQLSSMLDSKLDAMLEALNLPEAHNG